MGRLVLAAAAFAFCPAVLLAQAQTTNPAPPAQQPTTTQPRAGAAASGEVIEVAGAVTPQMLAGQKDPKLIGSPAWWETHETADGKPRESTTH